MEEQRELADSDNAMENGGPAITKMFTLTAEAKIPAVVSYVKELLEDAEEDKKFLVFCHHRVMMDALEAEFKKMKVGRGRAKWQLPDNYNEFRRRLNLLPCGARDPL